MKARTICLKISYNSYETSYSIQIFRNIWMHLILKFPRHQKEQQHIFTNPQNKLFLTYFSLQAFTEA